MEELHLVKDELALAQEELKASEEQAAVYHERLNAVGVTAMGSKPKVFELLAQVKDLEDLSNEAAEQIAEYEELLEESRTDVP